MRDGFIGFWLRPRRITALSIARACGMGIALGVGAVTLAAQLASLHRYFELTSHFRAQYLAISLGCVAYMTVVRAWRWMGFAILCAGINAVSVAPWIIHGAPPAGGHDLRVLLSNVYGANRNHEAVLNLIARENPGVVIAEEATPVWMNALSGLNNSHPFMRQAGNRDGAAIVVFSRFPITDLDVDVPFAIVAARIATGNGDFTLIAIHPPPPMNDGMMEFRNAQLATVADLVKRLPQPVVVAADLNTSLWSPYFNRFAADSGLVSARKNFGILPTWPTNNPFLRIPIDHVMVSAGIQVADCRVGSDVGSDHFPLIVDLILPRAFDPAN